MNCNLKAVQQGASLTPGFRVCLLLCILYIRYGWAYLWCYEGTLTQYSLISLEEKLKATSEFMTVIMFVSSVFFGLLWCDRVVLWVIISVTSQWARWRLKSPASRLFTQSFQAQIKENSKALRHWHLWGECTCDWWIPRTKGQ